MNAHHHNLLICMAPNDNHLREHFIDDARMRFEALYERRPSWDVDFPQPAFVELEERGWIRGKVLDAGCGTGEIALFLASKGYNTWGIDLASAAIGQARSKARLRALPAARFLLLDALSLDQLGMQFDTVVDSGLLHAMTDGERRLYVASVASVLAAGGMMHVLCFSDAQPGQTGPRRIARDEIAHVFADGWKVREIEPTRFMTHIHDGGAAAWRVSVVRLG